MLYFDTEKYNFWPIYDRIKKYYPLGFAKDDAKIMYNAFPGIKDLQDLIFDNIHDAGHFSARWESFESLLRLKTKKNIEGTTYGQAPCFSACMELERTVYDGLIRVKELCFFVSLLGPFYTVIGQDRSEISMGKQTIRTTNFLVISPQDEYADAFNQICELIEARFVDFRFIPFGIARQQIEALQVHYAHERSDTVFQALFNEQIDLDSRTWGNVYFKADEWIINGYQDRNGWTSHPPLGYRPGDNSLQ